MHSEELMQWLRERELLSIAKAQSALLKCVLSDSLNVEHEGVMVVGDYGVRDKLCAPMLAAGYYIACKSLGLDTALLMQEVRGREQEASLTVRHMLKRLRKGNIVIFSMSNRLGKLKIPGGVRGLMKERKHKYLLTTGLVGLKTEQFYALAQAIKINYRKVSRACDRIKDELDWARQVRIVTLNGTNLKVDVTGHTAHLNAGYVKSRGEGGNIPAGEVYIAPTRDGVDGTLVIDGSSRNKDGTALITRPIRLTVNRGMVTRVEGGDEARMLRDSLDWIRNKVKQPSNATRIGELGIGVNPNAKVIGSTIVDEKAYGTAHVGIGGNSWFGGHVFSSLHFDQVFRNPVITVDGKELKMPRKSDLE